MRIFLQRCWRVPLTAMSFALFGFGGIVLGAIVFPAIRLMSPREATGRRCRRAIQRSFRLFLAVLSFLRLMRFEFRGDERLLHLRGRLVIANHPSLLDVVVLVSRIPDARCVVKHAVWRSPFLGTVVRLAGYVPSIDPQDVVDRTVRLLQAGETVVLFPEGTRTRKDRPATVRRGAALILLRSDRPALPGPPAGPPSCVGKDRLSSTPATGGRALHDERRRRDPSVHVRAPRQRAREVPVRLQNPGANVGPAPRGSPRSAPARLVGFGVARRGARGRCRATRSRPS